MKKSLIVNHRQLPIMMFRLSTLTLAMLWVGVAWSSKALAQFGVGAGQDIEYLSVIAQQDEQPLLSHDDMATEHVVLRPKSRRSVLPVANPKQRESLEKLTSFYQKNHEIVPPEPPEKQVSNAKQTPMCQGTWVYPNTATTKPKTMSINGEFPMYMEADYGYYDNQNYAELEGNVKLSQGNQQISANKMMMDMATGVANAHGNVMVVDNQTDTVQNSGLITLSNEMTYDVNSTKGIAKDVAFASVPLQAHGYAKQLQKVNNHHYQIDEVMFTTCEPDKPTWQISAKNLDLDTSSGRGKAYNATLKVKNTPVLYLPYFNFPIDDRRTSGFLVPKIGLSSGNGLTVQTPYYFNLAPNYDATITPTVYTNRNPMLTGEFRYLTESYGTGELTLSHLPNDRQYHGNDRTSALYHHQWQSTRYPTLSAHAIYQYTSDSSYLNDFQTFGSYTNQLNLPRRIQVNYYDDNITALAKFESFQTLDNNLSDNQEILDKDKPYYRLPQISMRYRVPNSTFSMFNLENLPIEITGTSDIAYFKRPINDNSAPEQSGGRVFNKITATYPFSRSWGYIKPSISLQHLYTQYDEETLQANNIDKENRSQSVFVPEYSVDTGLHFFKSGSPFGKFDQTLGGYQLITPRLKYVYAPYKDQTNIPNFNTRLVSLNFPQLFENSRFLGYERLPDNHFITSALNYRYIDNQGLTRLDASIGQQWFLDDIRVRLDNRHEPLKIKNTGTVWQLSSQPYQNFWVDMDGSVDNSGKLGYMTTQLRYVPNNRSQYQFGFIQRNANELGQKKLSAITTSVMFPLSQQWQFTGTLQYDNLNQRLRDIIVGLTYDSCCYGLSVYGRRYYDELDVNAEATNAIMAEINLLGIRNRQRTNLSNVASSDILK